MATSPERNAYRWMDVTRACAATAVVWQHGLNLFAGDGTGQAGGLLKAIGFSASFGRDAVMIFFVVSGFWISRTVRAAIAADRWSWTDYGINRLSRLWAVLLPALLIGGALDLIGRFAIAPAFYAAYVPDGTAAFDVLEHLTFAAFVGNMLFLQQIAVPPWGTNGPLWTLACEFWYYVWFPALLLIARGRRAPVTWAILVVSILVALASSTVALLFGCWLVGALVQEIDARWTARGVARLGTMQRAAVLAAGLLAWAAGEALSRIDGVDWFTGCYCVSIGAGLGLLAILRAEPALPRALAGVARYGAGASFSLYAIHLPLLIFIKTALFGAAPLPVGYRSVAIAVAASACAIGAAWVFAGLTEAKTGAVRDRARRLIGRRPARA